jgi:hypothetical protein
MLHAQGSSPLPGHSQHLRADVDPEDHSVRGNEGRGPEGNRPGAGPEIKDVLSWP